MLADLNGTVHPLRWWFTQQPRELMQALSSPVNDVITPGNPDQSSFFTGLIAPAGPMGSVFSLPAASSPGKTRRDVVHEWIMAGCPLAAAPLRAPSAAAVPHTSLWLTTPAAATRRHPTGKIYGMGSIH
jgi:hypothetical protein